MLRELVGDEPFTRGLRRFYSASRFRNVSAADFKATMEREAGRPLSRFFDRWIDGSTLPRLVFSYRVEGDMVVLHVEQVGEVFDMPVAVTLRYENRLVSTVLIPVTERVVDQRVALAGPLRSAEINPNDGALVEVLKN
jgi:aminopeptidase N